MWDCRWFFFSFLYICKFLQYTLILVQLGKNNELPTCASDCKNVNIRQRKELDLSLLSMHFQMVNTWVTGSILELPWDPEGILETRAFSLFILQTRKLREKNRRKKSASLTQYIITLSTELLMDINSLKGLLSLALQN